MKKSIVIIMIVTILTTFVLYGLSKFYQFWKIKTAKIEVLLKEPLELEVTEHKKISDFIISINGEIIDDAWIRPDKLGKKKIKFSFINEDDIKVNYEYEVNIVDRTEPMIWLGNIYTIQKGQEIDFNEVILCGDAYDKNPKCKVEGMYDIHTSGEYPLTYVAVDQSGNRYQHHFVLRVVEPVIETNKKKPTSMSKEPVYTDFQSIKKQYKTPKTKIGIDVSSWQGKIDFQKLKDAGVEFIMIRVGGTRGTNGEYFLDKRFQENIKNANKYNIPAGIYFYSYSDSNTSAKKDAEWVLKQIKNYKIDLPIAYDWEEWKYFNSYNLSFFGLTNMAETFLDTVHQKGYEGMLYSSKAYLENVWYPTDYDTWLAHYTNKTNYQGSYRMWQLCDNGKVDGIEGAVDIDIMYEK